MEPAARSLRRVSTARRVLGWPLRRVLDRRVDWILAAMDERIGRRPGLPSLHDRLDRLEGRPGTGAATAELLNWAEGPEGPAARAGLWFNPPVSVRHGVDSTDVQLVNERIVEQPYVFAALAGLSAPARILDVGGSESTVALSLASLGHEVHVVDPRGYPLAHPGLHVHPVALDDLAAGPPFDVAVALSSIEHFGLGGYGARRDQPRLDVAALEEIRSRLAPDGLLVLTVPCGAESSVDDFQRVYTPAELRELLAGWRLIDFSVAWRRDRLTWLRGAPGGPPAESGVGLVSVRRRAP